MELKETNATKAVKKEAKETKERAENKEPEQRCVTLNKILDLVLPTTANFLASITAPSRIMAYSSDRILFELLSEKTPSASGMAHLIGIKDAELKALRVQDIGKRLVMFWRWFLQGKCGFNTALAYALDKVLRSDSCAILPKADAKDCKIVKIELVSVELDAKVAAVSEAPKQVFVRTFVDVAKFNECPLSEIPKDCIDDLVRTGHQVVRLTDSGGTEYVVDLSGGQFGTVGDGNDLYSFMPCIVRKWADYKLLVGGKILRVENVRNLCLNVRKSAKTFQGLLAAGHDVSTAAVAADLEGPAIGIVRELSDLLAKVDKVLEMTVLECCWSCGAKPAKLEQCSKCHKAPYCNRICQGKHWIAAHRARCKEL